MIDEIKKVIQILQSSRKLIHLYFLPQLVKRNIRRFEPIRKIIQIGMLDWLGFARSVVNGGVAIQEVIKQME